MGRGRDEVALVEGVDVGQDGDAHDWLGSKQPTWMPGTSMDLHRRWDYRITAALEAPAAGEFVVAADVWRQDGDGYVPSKRFCTFPSAEAFFTEYLPWHAKRCYYEVMPADKQVNIHFDVEWTSDERENGKLPGIIQAIEEVICARWPEVPAQLLRDGRNIWQGGRDKGRRFKNSFHVVYYTVMASWNHGALRRLGRELAKSMDSRLCVDGVSVVDGNVYNRNQQYRLPRCWKIDDVSSTDFKRIELTETGFVWATCTLQAALRAVATGPGAANAVTVTEDQLNELEHVALS